MDSEPGKTIFVIGFLIVVAFAGGYIIGSHETSQRYDSEAIERGFAEHDSKTGLWKWKEGGEKHE